MKRFGKLGALIVFSLCLCMISAFTAFAVNLVDIDGHWAEEYIEYGVEKGYINGYDDGTFLPDKTVTRAEFSKMINSAIKLTAVGTAKADFYDVVVTEWYFNEIKKAENAGYITGYEDGSFRPSNSVTRQEAAVILSRIVLPVNERASVNSFADGNTIDTWATDAVTMIAAKGYIKGDEYTNFNPKSALTRSQAAKLICEFVKNENIVNKNQNVTEADGKIIYSESLFTDDIVIDVEGMGDLSVEFVNCRVLGNVYLKNEDVAVTFENTKAKALYADEEDIKVELDKTSEVKTAYVSYPVTLEGNGFKNVVLLGDLSTGFVELDGTFQNVDVKGNAFVTCGMINNLNVSNKISLTVMSGSIENLVCGIGAKGATINLSKNVNVESVNNNAAVSYVGSGTIENANNGVSGVSYDGVTVGNITGIKDSGENADSKTDDEFFEDVMVIPEDNDTNIALSSDVTLYFEREVFDINGDELDAGYIEDTFELRIGGESGSKVAFEAVVAGSNMKITVAPTSYLRNDTEYCFVIPADTLTYEDGTANGEYIMYFETVSVYDDDDDDDDYNNNWNSDDVTITFEPGDGEVLEAGDKIVVRFSERVYKSTSKKELDANYCENQAFEIRKGSTYGPTVKFTAEVESWYNTVTLKPDKMLEAGATYYVIVNSGKLYDYDGNTVYGDYSYFETDNGISVSISPANGATNISLTPEIVLEFSEPVLNLNGRTLTNEDVEDGVIQLTEYYYSNTRVSFTAKVSDDAKTITITPSKPLSANTTYYVNVLEGSLIGKNSDEEIEAVSTYFTVASSNSPTITPASGKKNVSVDTKVEITFADKLYKYSYSYYDQAELTKENIEAYVDEANVVTLRRGDVDGTIIPCKVTLSDDGKTIILTPKQDLSLNRTYFVVVNGYTLTIGKDSYTRNDSAVSSFSTNETLMPEFKLGNGEDERKVSITSSFEITFDEDIKNVEGDELSARRLVNEVISLYKRDNPEEEVGFTASIYNNRVITVKPSKNLEGGTYYVLKVNGSTVKNDSGTLNQMSSIEFKTENVVDRTVTLEPKAYSSDVSIYENPKIVFASPVYKDNLKDITTMYVNDYIGLYEGYYAYEENKVDATVEFSKDFKTFTIVPKKPLKKNTYYYIHIDNSKFVYDDGYSIYYYSGYFTTTSKDQCPICHDFHTQAEHVCSKCGEKGHETETWCEVCNAHVHAEGTKLCEECGLHVEACQGHTQE